MTLGKDLTMAASASIFYIAIDYKNKTNMTVATSKLNIKTHRLFSRQQILGVCLTVSQLKI